MTESESVAEHFKDARRVLARIPWSEALDRINPRIERLPLGSPRIALHALAGNIALVAACNAANPNVFKAAHSAACAHYMKAAAYAILHAPEWCKVFRSSLELAQAVEAERASGR